MFTKQWSKEAPYYKSTMLRKPQNKGLTLIEVLIYVALSAVLIGSAFVTIAQLIDSTRDVDDKNTTQEEGNFVLRKIDWALTGVDPAITPSIGGSSCNENLSIHKTDSLVSPVLVKADTIDGVNYIQIKKHTGDFYPITTSNVIVSCLEFDVITGSPSGITATATIDGKIFTITKYVRK